MILTREQRQLRKEIQTDLEKARNEAVTKFLQKRCNTIAVTFEEKPFIMATDIIRPIQGCPNMSGCTACNECGYYITHDKSKGVVYCMKMKQIRHKQRMNRQRNIKNQPKEK